MIGPTWWDADEIIKSATYETFSSFSLEWRLKDAQTMRPGWETAEKTVHSLWQDWATGISRASRGCETFLLEPCLGELMLTGEQSLGKTHEENHVKQVESSWLEYRLRPQFRNTLMKIPLNKNFYFVFRFIFFFSILYALLLSTILVVVKKRRCFTSIFPFERKPLDFIKIMSIKKKKNLAWSIIPKNVHHILIIIMQLWIFQQIPKNIFVRLGIQMNKGLGFFFFLIKKDEIPI